MFELSHGLGVNEKPLERAGLFDLLDAELDALKRSERSMQRESRSAHSEKATHSANLAIASSVVGVICAPELAGESSSIRIQITLNMFCRIAVQIF